jgi:uncharacterized protein (DUF736 family)
VTNIGCLRPLSSESGVGFEGEISTLEISIRFRLVPARLAAKSSAPTYFMVAQNSAGVRVRVGAAWEKIIKRGDRAGERFLTFTIDDPALQKPLNVAAFRNRFNGNWDIQFRRRQRRSYSRQHTHQRTRNTHDDTRRAHAASHKAIT